MHDRRHYTPEQLASAAERTFEALRGLDHARLSAVLSVLDAALETRGYTCTDDQILKRVCLSGHTLHLNSERGEAPGSPLMRMQLDDMAAHALGLLISTSRPLKGGADE